MSWPEHGYDTAPPVHQYNTPPALIAFTLAILVVCFVAFSIVYLCKFCLVSVSQSWAFERSASGSLVRLSPNRSPSRSGGIDPSLLHMFPTFEYSFVKELRITMKNNDNKKKKKKHFLECAICLLEFEDDSMLRLLPICCHVFHQECIDLWLCSHKTCPVCRTDLNFPSSDTRRRIKHDSEFNNNNNHNHDDDDDDEDEDDATEGDHPCEEEGSAGGDIRIDIRDGELGDDCESARARGEHDHHQDQDQDQMGVNVQQQQQAEHTRSHSTGHSIVMIKGEEVGVEKEGGGGDDHDDDDDDDDDEYTLRLPEHVIIRATRSSSSGGRHNCSKSCISYQEMQIMATTNCGFMESLSAAASSPSLPCAQKA